MTYILKGWYVEEWLDDVGYWRTGKTEYKEGESHYVDPNKIHRIISLPKGECWTLIVPEEKVQEPGFFKIENDKVFYRQWDEVEWKVLI